MSLFIELLFARVFIWNKIIHNININVSYARFKHLLIDFSLSNHIFFRYDRSCERVHRCLRFSLCSLSDIGGGCPFNSLLVPCSRIAKSTAYVCNFCWLSFLLVPNLGRTVE